MDLAMEEEGGTRGCVQAGSARQRSGASDARVSGWTPPPSHITAHERTSPLAGRPSSARGVVSLRWSVEMTMMGGQPQQTPPPQVVQVQQPAAAFGDTTLTKVFVGGLAWETHKDTLREHFERFGDILEAVIISDKLTGRSKGYGFVTFKEADAAKKACEDATPVINGRRANCNLASLGAKPRAQPPHLLRPSPPATPGPHAPALPSPHHHQPAPAIAVGSRGVSPVPWYYHPSTTPPPAAAHYAAHGGHHQQYHGVLPFYPAATTYGYSPNYVADLSYNAKLGQAAAAHGTNGAYLQGHFSYPAAAQGGMLAANGMMPVYPYYQYHYHGAQGLGVPAAHFFPPVSAAAVATVPAIISKPTVMAPPKVEQVTGCS